MDALPQRRGLAGRFLPVVVSAVLLGTVASQIEASELLKALGRTRPVFLFAALGVNGFLFIPAAMRWHLVLRATDLAVSYGATLVSALAGHFFYIGLFGAVGGDSARSYYYSRWHDRPLARVLATAPLDRLLGFCGLLCFATGGFSLALSVGGMRNLEFGFGRHPVVWLIPGALLFGTWWWVRQSSKSGFVRELGTAFRQGIRSLQSSPRIAVVGIGCGMLVQASLSGVLALNLQAVTPAPIEWTRLVWTFPLISILGGLPITVAGLGTREAAAVALLGLYGVPGEAAMAASLLCLACSLFWALAGAILFWREDRLKAHK